MVWRARKDTLTLENLPLPASHTSDAAHATFAEAWDAHLHDRRSPAPGTKPRKPSLLSVLWSQYWRDLLVAGVFKAGWSVLVIFGAYFFVRSILIYVTGAPPFDAVWKGWLLTAFFWLDAWLLGTTDCWYSWGTSGGGCCVSVCDKTTLDLHDNACVFLRLSNIKTFQSILRRLSMPLTLWRRLR